MPLTLLISQHLDSPVALERVQYKARTGSSKACDMLRSLFEFTAIAVLGGDPLDAISLTELQNQLEQAYQEQMVTSSAECIQWAIRWAWPPLEQGRIVFDSAELLQAVEGLYELLNALPPETLIRNTLQFADSQGLDGFDYEFIGENFKALGIPSILLDAILTESQCKFFDEIMIGFQLN